MSLVSLAKEIHEYHQAKLRADLEQIERDLPKQVEYLLERLYAVHKSS